MIEREPFVGWIIKEELGRGGFGKVYKVEKDNYYSAVKQIIIPRSDEKLDFLNDKSDEEILEYFRPIAEKMKKEVEIMQELSGIQGVVTYFDHILRKYSLYNGWEILIRMEYLTPLYVYIKKNGFTLRQILNLVVELCSALELCRRKNILHRDIKESNIFINNHGYFKISDFGSSKSLSEFEQTYTFVGTMGYIAPEIIRREKYDYRADMYALGVVLYKLLNDGAFPYEEKKKNTIQNSEYGEIIKAVLKSCAFNKDDRFESFARMGDIFKNFLRKFDSMFLDQYLKITFNNQDKNNKNILDSINDSFVEYVPQEYLNNFRMNTHQIQGLPKNNKNFNREKDINVISNKEELALKYRNNNIKSNKVGLKFAIILILIAGLGISIYYSLNSKIYLSYSAAKSYGQNDYTQAFKLYSRLSKQGDKEAQYCLGVMYYNGDGTKKDVKKAFNIILNSAEKGLVKAQYFIARLYYNGEGTPKDYEQAYYWCRVAAQNNYPSAQYMLGFMYKMGDGTTKNKIEAQKWLEKAARAGVEEAKKELMKN